MSISSNVLFSGTNLIGSATLSGGDFTRGQPLANLQSMDMWKYGRFDSLVSSSTYVVAEFSELKSFQLVAALAHNISAVGLWRIRIADTLALVTSSPTYDSGWVKITPAVTGYGVSEWGDFSWGDVTANTFDTILNRHGWHVMDESVEGKFVRIDFDDELENEFGYIELSRLWLGEISQPSYNALYGAKVMPIDKTKVRTAESGVRTYGTRYVRRGLALDFELSEAELINLIYGPLYMINGKAGEIVCILQPTLPETFIFQSVYGNILELQDAVHSTYARMTTSLIVDERV